jgi:hypothetical protein
MMVKKVLLFSFITLCFLFLLLGLYVNTNELSQTRQELASTRIELTTTQADLALTEAKLETKDTELTLAQADLTATQTDLAKTQDELQDTSDELVQTQADYTKTSEALDSEKQLTASLQSILDNLQANYYLLTTSYGYVLKDPTYQQVKAFIAADTTDTNTYVDDTYVCEDFSYDVKVHAMQQKYRCAFVSIRYPDSAHAIVAFNTTDRGLIYIEPQSDEEVNLQAGRHYYQCFTPLHPAPYYNDTIERFNLIW